MFTVTGYHDGVAYGVAVDPDATPVLVTAPSHVSDLLVEHQGDDVRATPTSESLMLAFDDAASVLAALYQYTEVLDVIGDAPYEEAGLESAAGVVY